MFLTLPSSINRFLEAAPVNVDDAELGEVVTALDVVSAEVPLVGMMIELAAPEVVADVVDVVLRATLVPLGTTLVEMTGLEVKIIVDLPLVIVHCVVTAGLLWKVIVLDPEGTSHSVMLLVTVVTGDTMGEVIVAVRDEFVVPEKLDCLLVDVVEEVIVAVDVLKSG